MWQRSRRPGGSPLDGARRSAERTGHRPRWVLALAALVAAVGPCCAFAQQPTEGAPEYAVKAAYLYQFGHFVEWPGERFVDERSPLVIGVLGPDPFGALLDEVAHSKRVEGRPIVIRRLTNPDAVAECHILFIASSASAEHKTAVLRSGRGIEGVLLVGEEPGFAEHGGMINFVIEQNHVRLEINATAAREAHLRISSKLLSLARLASSR